MGQTRPTERERIDPANEGAASKADKIGPVANDLRDRDFPLPPQAGTPGNEAVTVDQGVPEPETITAGGKVGTVEGDTQKLGEAEAIMDQDEATPDFAPDR